MSARASGRIVPSFALSFAVLAGAPTLANDSENPSEFRRGTAPSASLAQEELGLSVAWERELGQPPSSAGPGPPPPGWLLAGLPLGSVVLLARDSEGGWLRLAGLP